MNRKPHLSRMMYPLLLASMLGASGNALLDDIGRELDLPDRPKTKHDLERIAAADAKRMRKAMKKART